VIDNLSTGRRDNLDPAIGHRKCDSPHIVEAGP
jgi:hypothetical protein